jgi:hypothetical protein
MASLWKVASKMKGYSIKDGVERKDLDRLSHIAIEMEKQTGIYNLTIFYDCFYSSCKTGIFPPRLLH